MAEDRKLKAVLDAYTPKDLDPKIIDGYDTDLQLIKDSSALNTVNEIFKHKKSVKEKLNFLSEELADRAEHHDDSKLKKPEIGWLIEMDKEPIFKYGTPEYFEKKKKWQKFFDHHYALNRHHPEHFIQGVQGMTLIDLCEYCCDIISYFAEMHPKQAIQTVEQQQSRFGFDEQLTQVLKNTLIDYFTWVGNLSPLFKQK